MIAENDGAQLRIYFDTNILLQHGWPKPGAKLRGLLTLARALQLNAVLPEAVEREVGAHWFRVLEKSWANLRSAQDRLLETLGDVEAEDVLQPNWLDADSVETAYCKSVELIKSEWHLLSAPMSSVPLDHCFQMAIAHLPPFEDQEKAFRTRSYCSPS